MSSYPLPIINKKVNKTEMNLIGIKHTKEFFARNKDFFEDEIKKSPGGVIIEKDRNSYLSNMQYEYGFFEQVGEIAYKNNTPIYQVDSLNKKTGYLDKLLSLASAAYLIGSNFEPSINNLISTNLLIGSTPGSIILSIFLKDINPMFNDTIRSLTTYGEVDWRNTKIAKGIEKITLENKGKLSVFHGALHTYPVSFYLDNPKIRALKEKIYFPYHLLGEKAILKGFREELQEEEIDYLKNVDKERFPDMFKKLDRHCKSDKEKIEVILNVVDKLPRDYRMNMVFTRI